MSQNEFVTQTTPIAEAPVSAPVTEVNEEAAVNTESAPVIEEVSEETTDENIEENGAKPSKVVRELIEQRKKRQELERKLAFTEGLLAGREKVQEPTPVVQPPVQTLKKPESSDFDTWEEYEEARDVYTRETTKREIFQSLQQAQTQQLQQVAQLTFQQKLDKAAKEDLTIADILSDQNFPMHRDHVQILQSSDQPEEVLKWLHKNRDDAMRIYSMNPLMAAREFGKIEAQIKLAPKVAAPKKVSSAPEPIKTITPASSLTVDEDNLPTDEWMKRRNQAQYGKK